MRGVPIAGVLVWAIVLAGTAKWVERIFLSICVVYLSYVVSAFFAKPEWLIALLNLLPPQLMHLIPTVRQFVQVPPFTAGYAVILAGLVGIVVEGDINVAAGLIAKLRQLRWCQMGADGAGGIAKAGLPEHS